MSALRQRFVWSAYLAAIAMAMVGWVWALFEGVGWVLGV